MSEVIRAPFGGWVTRWWSQSGGYTVAITTNWVKFTIQHLSAYAGKSAGQVNEGDVIGYVGNTGTATTGPHVHCWIILIESGQRISFEQYLVNQGWETAALWSSVPGPHKTATLADSGGATPFPKPKEDSNMRVLKSRGQGEFVRLGEMSALMLNESNAKIEATIWNPDGQIQEVSDAGFSQAIADALAERTRFINAIPRASESAAPVIDYAKLAGLIKIPTAAENADATRAKFTTSPLS
jgi:hypothetical protein